MISNKASYTERLQERGVEVLCRPYIGSLERYLDRHAREFSVIVLSRVGVADRYIGRARKTAPDALIVFDTVDLHFVREKRQARLEDDKHLLELANHRMRQELAVAAQAEVTLVVSPTEKELLERHSPGLRVEVLSNIHEVYGSRTAWAEREGILFVGGFNHPPNTDAVLYFVEDILPMVRSPGDVPVYIVGSHPTPQVQSVARRRYTSPAMSRICRTILIAAAAGGAAALRRRRQGEGEYEHELWRPGGGQSMAVEGMHLRHGWMCSGRYLRGLPTACLRTGSRSYGRCSRSTVCVTSSATFPPRWRGTRWNMSCGRPSAAWPP